MLETIKLSNILFLDVETAPIVYEYKNLDPEMKKLWDHKFRFQTTETAETHYKKAGIFAEYAKVICISVGFFNGKTFRIKSFFGDDEKKILKEFTELLNKHYNRKDHVLCAHNGKEFDFPFLCRRLLLNSIKLPKTLNISGKKPWEINHLDTMELWKFGDNKNFTSLRLLAAVFDFPSPKDDMAGADVAGVYWEDRDLERIATYCEKDVLATVQLFLRMKRLPILRPDQVVVVR